MKTKLFLLFLLLVTLSAIKGSCHEEENYNPNTPPSHEYEHGVILISMDYGITWQEKIIPSVEIINSITSTSEGIYLAVGGNTSRISTDFGNSWHLNHTLNDVDEFIISNSMNSAISFGVVPSSLYQGVARTTNNGTNWVLNSGENLKSVSAAFTNSSEGVAAGIDGKIYKTIDSGLTWNFTSQPIGSLKDICCYGQTYYVAGDEGKIARSTDGGVNWAEVPTGIFDNLRGITCFYGAGGVISVGDNGRILRTVNNGINWTEHGTTIEDHMDVAVIDYSTLISVCASGTIYRTDDYGVKWSRNTNYTAHYFFKSVYFDYITGRVLITGQKRNK